MRRLLLKSCLLALPFAVIAAIVVLVDPYDYFAWNDGRTSQTWDDIASRTLMPLWKLSAYRRHPAPNILLGDSRMGALDAERVSAVTGERYANLAYGGGSLDEAIRTFWLADHWTPLRSVTLGVNLDLYNESNAKDRVSAVAKILNNPALYVCDRVVLGTVWNGFAYRLTGHRPELGVPSMSRDQFWRFQLEVTARVAFENYRRPETQRRRLEEIAAYCRKRGIRLRIVVFPEHRDLVQVQSHYRLEDERLRMVADLRRLGDTTDLRNDSLDADRARFIDPFHFNHAVGDTIIRRVWGGDAAAASVGSATGTPAVGAR
jgi:hypothetical protein